MEYGSSNHFERQKQNKWWSLLFGSAFAAGIVFLFFGIYFFITALAPWINSIVSQKRLPEYSAKLYETPNNRTVQAPAASVISLTAVAIAFIFSYARITQIKAGGGTYVPSLLKAVPLGDGHIFLNPEAQRQEKILRNVIGELAVATGLQEPDVYVLLNEDYINAMACGLEEDDSSIVITKGCLKYLDRDELRALLAHEFSHLANSDTRHFTLMAGWLHGLLVLNTLSFRLLTTRPNVVLIFLSASIMLVSFLANCLGKVIQAAFSRSRERLADSSAAQFTRDPLALASVLKKIGGQSDPKRGSLLRHPDFRHLYATEIPSLLNKFKLPKAILSLLSTHPPIEDRVWELDPNWDGWYWDFERNPVDFLTAPSLAAAQANRP
ncbi:MAG: M48 family metalloprotease [Deltaproteobacteria bacterium]|jgi:Zn-dependent protease with chaperone function|nr:M48 family metalloprotease [Deltaproteobacteria bacterium]